ncbi:MAG: hypothetical protein EOL91_11190 [Actinobacteria bacterium]|nr:hypothetical protein [Actinomycetota bacterium]
MAARKTKHLSAEWRQKIQTSMLINRLSDFVKGDVEMSAPQVTAALGLLKKSLPDLQAVQLSGDEDNPVAVLGSIDVTAELLKRLPADLLQRVLDEQSQNNGS